MALGKRREKVGRELHDKEHIDGGGRDLGIEGKVKKVQEKYFRGVLGVDRETPGAL
jgi:hypothetical protein